MKKALPVLAVILALGVSVAFDADAKRLGGARSSGMQRQSTPPAPHTAPGTPAQQAAPAAAPNAPGAAPGAAAAAAPKRSWMGPIAGLAAGLGLAALASHLGFGGALANMMMIGLLVMAALMVFGFIMRKRASSQNPAMAGAGTMHRQPLDQPADGGGRPQGGSMIGSRIGGDVGAAASNDTRAAIPADFDKAAFESNAKKQFIALQAANDARDLDRLREYLSPEMLDVVRAEIADRGDAPQRTEVFGLEAQVLGVAEEDGRYIASVRFTGSVRDQHGAVPDDLDEIWHLVKPRDGLGGWLIAGIQQHAA